MCATQDDDAALKELYQAIVMDHGKTPRNATPPADATVSGKGNNPMCGDRVTVHLTLEADRVRDAGFDGRGCAISIASASMMTELVKGRSAAEARALADAFETLVCGDAVPADAPDLGDLSALAGVRHFPTRIKCATLAWSAMRAALDGSDAVAKTE